MKDALPKRIGASECGIVNMEDSDASGSHWIAYFNDVNFDMVEYFDSFGVCPPAEIERYLRTSSKALAYSTTQYQSLTSILCGWYCLLFINERWKGTSPHELLSWPLDEKMIKSYTPFHRAAAFD
jgi:hypothetical protein